ncbi:hypothetical protein CYCD_22040 [Tenuifilaceae bacterium CYCD]|nr:hypothetical protein CYCD_22040 [Tenuifilaceae bacterium CYCD]
MKRFFVFISVFVCSFGLIAQERGFVNVRRVAKDHIALVIGNSNYPEAPLANPANDATDVAKTFSDMGFIVEKVIDADREQMAQAISRFAQHLLTAKAAVFYYAGHGMQVNGENYLIPIGRTEATQISDESQVPYRAINVGEVLTAMEQANVNFSMVVLDACRNNPFKGLGRGRIPGLASVNAPVGSLVMYATKAGSTASDGLNTRNSPFTTAFLKHINTPGLDVNLLPSKITQTVGELTHGGQVPGTYMQLSSSFSFVPAMNPDEEKIMKEAQLKKLQLVDADLARKEAEIEKKRQADDALLAKKQADIDALDKQISELKAKTASGEGNADTDLDKMLEYVKQNEAQKKEMELLQQQAEERRVAREKEMYDIKMKEYDDLKVKVDADFDKYQKIANSEFGKDMAQVAWDKLLVKYGLPIGSINRDDEYTLKAEANPHPNGLYSTSGAPEGLAFIPGGAFNMGNPDGHSDIEKLHSIFVKSFYMMKYEVTVGQFKQFVDATGYKTDAEKNGSAEVWNGEKWVEETDVNWRCDVWGSISRDAYGNESYYLNRPAIYISWNDAAAYAQWLSGITGKTWRLPTEAEWECAAKAGQSLKYAGSDNIDDVAWYDDNSDKDTHDGGMKEPNGLGLYDMTGNVSEWCSDWYDSYYYINCAVSNPAGPTTGVVRVIRGGSFRSMKILSGVTRRDSMYPNHSFAYTGFRLVCEP